MPDDRSVAASLIAYLANPNGLVPPEPLGAPEAATQALALYEASGRKGATLNPHFGDMSRQPLYAVSLYPERTRKSAGDTVSVRILQLFIAENADLLADPRCSIGLWYNADEDVTYRDVTATLPIRQGAMTLARRYDQIAIFDLGTLAEIETGGTGNTPADMPPATERLPRIGAPEEEQR